MKKWARLNEEGVVVEIVVDSDNLPGAASIEVVETSSLIEVNDEGLPGQYASIGFIYSEDLKGFIAPKVFDSWKLNEESFQWEAPEPRPETGEYSWDEDSKKWINV